MGYGWRRDGHGGFRHCRFGSTGDWIITGLGEGYVIGGAVESYLFFGCVHFGLGCNIVIASNEF